jgi:hypothetical protein
LEAVRQLSQAQRDVGSVGRGPWDRSRGAAHDPALSSLLHLKQGQACDEARHWEAHPREESGVPVRIQSCECAVFLGTRGQGGCVHSTSSFLQQQKVKLLKWQAQRGNWLLKASCGSCSKWGSGSSAGSATSLLPGLCPGASATSGRSWKAECLPQERVCVCACVCVCVCVCARARSS